MGKNSQDFDLQAVLRLANSPVGQRLLAALRQKDENAVGAVTDRAAAGDMEGARAALAGLMADPELQALAGMLGEAGNG